MDDLMLRESRSEHRALQWENKVIPRLRMHKLYQQNKGVFFMDAFQVYKDMKARTNGEILHRSCGAGSDRQVNVH